MKGRKFTGILPALITPFEKGTTKVNEQAARSVIDYQIKQGANGFYILGGTGEGFVMERQEREKMCEVAIDEVAGRVPVICHIAAANMEETVALARHAERVGADAVAAIPPVFFSYDADDIYNYYRRIAESVHIPVIIYYHPAAQKDITAKLVAKIFEIDNVTGVKWSSHGYFELLKLRDMTKGEMNIINGPDELLINGLMSGADAGIGSTYNIMLPEFLDLYRLFREGRLEEARALQLKINRVIDRIIAAEVIPGVKAACRMLGLDAGQASYPMRQIEGAAEEKLQKDLQKSGWPFGRSMI